MRSASELPARSVTVTLDGRFMVRTDDEGRFRFDRVAVGEHQVVMVSDNDERDQLHTAAAAPAA